MARRARVQMGRASVEARVRRTRREVEAKQTVGIQRNRVRRESGRRGTCARKDKQCLWVGRLGVSENLMYSTVCDR